VLKIFTSLVFPYTLLIVVAWTTVCWLAVTLLTAPEPDAHLIEFYRRTRPDGPGWRRIAQAAGVSTQSAIGALLVDWIAGVVLVYSVLFGIGEALLGTSLRALGFFALAAVAAAVIYVDLNRRGWKSVVE
jgi:hypothetical protein